MVNPLRSMLQFHTDALTLRGQRQQILASNIANADTPDYKARDIDFSLALKHAMASNGSAGSLTRTAAAHLAGAQQGKFGQALYRTVLQPSLDGNSVDMDVELAQFAENAVHFEANLAFINSQLKGVLTAIQG